MPTGARLAQPDDAPAIAEVQGRAWQAAFGDVLANLAAWDGAAVAEQWHAAISAPPSPAHAVLVAIDGEGGVDAVVGYAVIGPDDAPGALPTTGQLLDLVIDPVVWRRGHGSRVMQAAVDHLLRAGTESATTWILLEDAPRRQFLESAGWGPDGAYRDLDTGAGVVRQIRLVTDLTEPGELPGNDQTRR